MRHKTVFAKREKSLDGNLHFSSSLLELFFFNQKLVSEVEGLKPKVKTPGKSIYLSDVLYDLSNENRLSPSKDPMNRIWDDGAYLKMKLQIKLFSFSGKREHD